MGRLPVRGQLKLKVSSGNWSTDGSLTALGCSGSNLCGRDLIQAFHMLEAPVMNVSATMRRHFRREDEDEDVEHSRVARAEQSGDPAKNGAPLAASRLEWVR